MYNENVLKYREKNEYVNEEYIAVHDIEENE